MANKKPACNLVPSMSLGSSADAGNLTVVGMAPHPGLIQGPSTIKDTKYKPTKFSIRPTKISETPYLIFSKAGIRAKTAPNIKPNNITQINLNSSGTGRNSAAKVAPMEPKYNWPSAPRLVKPHFIAKVMLMAQRNSGVAKVKVSAMPNVDPREPLKM